MRVPLSWLAEYIPLQAEPAELIERLTLAGLESSGVQIFGKPVPAGVHVKPADAGLEWDRDQVVVATVLKIEKHPDADKLKMVTVDYGAKEPKTVITGAPNIAPGESGMKVILGLRGTKYYYTDKEGNKAIFTLEPKALRGIMNDAMCMSNYELGIADDHDGIIILDDDDAAPGTPVQDIMGEIVVEIDVLPNMARCLAMLGIARETAALLGGKVFIPSEAPPTIAATTADSVQVQIEDIQLCSRYTATIIQNMNVVPAPRWMRTRLQYAGMRPINNVVDITNYVMLEMGQPLHAFDYDVLKQRAGNAKPTIIVRSAKVGEKLKTLDGVERELQPEHLVIADTLGPIALAGVMGGLDTEVTAQTKTILLESATFDFVSVRKTARHFTLFSEASTRFSRGIHPELAKPAAIRAAYLFHKHANGQVLSGIVDAYPAPLAQQLVSLNRSEIERLLGVSMPDGEVERILGALEFGTTATPWGWTVSVPQNRLDIQAGAADLIEELARVSGYDRLPGRMLAQELPPQTGNRDLQLEERTRDLLADAGLSECITYSLSSPEAEAKLVPPGTVEPSPSDNRVSLLNPVSPERSTLRRTLLPGLLSVAAENLKNTPSVALFELGPIFLATKNPLPDEPRRLAVVLVGKRSETAWDDVQGVPQPNYDFYDLKGVLETLFVEMHIEKVGFAIIKDVPHLHPGRGAQVSIAGQLVGAFGELHPKVASAFKLGERAVLVAELDLDAVLKAVPERYPYKPISGFPPVLRDVAVIVSEEMTAERVLNEIRAGGGELLETASLFDVYRGDSIPTGTKSLAFALTYRRADRQLNDKEVDKAHDKIEGRLKNVLKATIRGKEGK